MRPLREQVVVLTGASSGIGRETAVELGRRGASVVLAARSEEGLRDVAREVAAAGGRALPVPTDVADWPQVERLAPAAGDHFGRIDTWVNNAAVALYGRLTALPVEDMRQQMEINYWGQVYGSLTAVRHLRRRGGALVNVGSALSDRAIPLQGNYCAAKHAIKAFTDTLRMEIEEEGLPISVTLVKPASIDTPFFDKAKTYLGYEPRPIPPVYVPEVVARVIVHAAQHPVREVGAGGGAAKVSAARFAPRLADRYMERHVFDAQKARRAATSERPSNLHAPLPSDGGARGRIWKGHTRRSSVYTKAVLHPAAALVSGLVAAAGVATMLRAATAATRRGPGPSAQRLTPRCSARAAKGLHAATP
jgi:NAD(P)-dependent dehydrogenase (short-subunit alcohol dehydrogenase family)